MCVYISAWMKLLSSVCRSHDTLDSRQSGESVVLSPTILVNTSMSLDISEIAPD